MPDPAVSDHRRRTLMISPQLPSRAQQESAGELLALRFAEFWEARGPLLVVSATGRANARAQQRGDLPDHELLTIEPSRAERLRGRLLTVQPVIPPRAVSGIPGLRSAEVIDLQWEEPGWLIRALRREAPQARITVTLHDVLSQRFGRLAAASTTVRHRLLWRLRSARVRRLEAQILRRADEVLVLSEKDAALLPRRRGGARVHVVAPPLQAQLRPSPPADAPPRLLFVGYLARAENQDAVRRLTHEILPVVRREFPAAEAVIAGGGLAAQESERLAAEGVQMLGFVDDLEPEYRRAAAVIVPLEAGAGVKFKVVEAMIRGIPVITTPVGIEGIPHAGAAWIADDSAGLAAAAIAVLRDREAAERRARDQASPLAEHFGLRAFTRTMQEMHP